MGTTYILTVILPLYLFMAIGLYGVFKKAGETSWHAFIPFLNIYTWIKMLGKPSWFMALVLIPIIGPIVMISLMLELLKSFDIEKYGHHVMGVIFAPFYLTYLGFNKTDAWGGAWTNRTEKEKNKKKSEGREWADAILFAGTAAIIIRTFMLEAFMIPTTSMEGSLLAGDFLFVSKFHYGVRMPMVPFCLPFIHNRIPVIKTKSYIDAVELPYWRLPGVKDVERNDIVVFNYPENDIKNDASDPYKDKPVSMKQNYIKRCVAVPGDTLEIRDKVVYIDNKVGWKADNLQYQYEVVVQAAISEKILEEAGFRFNKGSNDNWTPHYQNIPNHFLVYMNDKKAKEIEVWSQVKSVNMVKYGDMVVQQMYPQDPRNFPFNPDNFGPIVLPKKGVTVEINASNVSLYRRVIEAYEGHEFKMSGNTIYIDGDVASEYTFEMNYYWMMGDNRDQSLDSRFWGFVPEDHIVGRPWFVLLSIEDGIRWERLVTPITAWED